MSTLPMYVSAIVLTGVVAEVATVSTMLWRGARAEGAGRHTARVVAGGFAIAWSAWVGLCMALAGAGLFRFASDKPQPWLPLTMVAGATTLLLAARTRPVSRILARPDALRRLIAAQAFRVVGVAFLIAMMLGKLPAAFALPAGLGDVAVGIEAMLLTRRIRRGPIGRGLLWFNVFGLLDLVVAVTVGVTGAPGTLHLIPVSPSTADVALLPLVLIPTTLVPLAITLHVLSLRSLAAARRRSAHGESGPVRASVRV